MDTTSANSEPSSSSNVPDTIHVDDFEISSNWNVINDRLLRNTVSTVNALDFPERPTLEEIVSLHTCIRLEGDGAEKREPCNVDVKFTNGQKISKISIVSEATLVELYKEYGEYVTTEHAEFVDEFEDSAVYSTDITLNPASSEIRIKFARLRNPGAGMWLYGIRLSLVETTENNDKDTLNRNVIDHLLQGKQGSTVKSEWAKKLLDSADLSANPANMDMDLLLYNFMSVNISSQAQQKCRNKDARPVMKEDNPRMIGDSASIHDSNLKTYIDDKFKEMEARLMERIDSIDRVTTEKLDVIIRLLKTKQSST